MSREGQTSQGEDQLTVKDRLNHSYLLAKAMIAHIERMPDAGTDEESERSLRNTVEALYGTIPTVWKELDPDFFEEMQAAKYTKKFDIRPVVAGAVRLSENKCRKLGIKTHRDVVTFDYRRVYQACVNLLNRMNMLAKKNFVEELEEIDFDQEVLLQGMKEEQAEIEKQG